MATMPALVGFSSDYSLGVLFNLGIIPSVAYENVTYPQVSPGLVLAQSPSAGTTITGTVTLTLAGAVELPDVGVTVFSQPATLTGNDDNP